MSSESDLNIPQWMVELKKRKKCKVLEKQLCGGGTHPSGLGQHNPASVTSGSSAAVSRVDSSETGVGICNVPPTSANSSKMVQERAWTEIQQYAGIENGKKKESDSEDSQEDLQYGPGIVTKLKNRYLTLTLQKTNAKIRPSLSQLRRATSLEHLLDDDEDTSHKEGRTKEGALFNSRANGHISNNAVTRRYNRNATKMPEMKRARSVETISRSTEAHELTAETTKSKRESYHEMLIMKTEGNDKPWKTDNKISDHTENIVLPQRINKPLMIPRIMNEKEKPPADVVKQAVKIFEPPKLRSKPPQPTGEVAAKVGLFNCNKTNAKKPPIKQKPVAPVTNDVKKPPAVLVPNKQPNIEHRNQLNKIKSPDLTPISSTIPDVSRINEFEQVENEEKITTSLSETPDLILHSSPIHKTSPIKALEDVSSHEQNTLSKEDKNSNGSLSPNIELDATDFSLSFKPKERVFPMHSSSIPVDVPLHLDLNGASSHNKNKENSKVISPSNESGKRSPLLLQKTDSILDSFTKNACSNGSQPKLLLSERETKKNLINKQKSEQNNELLFAKSVDPSLDKIIPVSAINNCVNNEVPNKIEVPKQKHRSAKSQDNSMLFDFTKRGGGVPDYIQNQGNNTVAKIELPKIGEGGITILPGVILDESFIEEDWQKVLQGPPSPCDVNFVNHNILIDGKSSLRQKATKRNAKNKIKFVEAVPQIFEYPSEASLLDEIPTPPAAPAASSLSNVLPALSGSTLANYTPKTSYEDFQLGVTKSAIPTTTSKDSQQEQVSDLVLSEIEEPIAFSAGTNSDILF